MTSIYEPVRADLEQVERTLDTIRQAEQFSEIRKMLEHVLGGGGKRLRPLVALLAGKFGDYRPEPLVFLAASIELLHTASLVHDDVIDRSSTRRGRPTANALFDNQAAVMLGDFMFAHAADLVARTDNTEVVRVFSRTLMAMVSGELTQDLRAYDYSQDIVSYFERIAGKTASLFAASCEGGAMLAGAPREWVNALRDYGHDLGMAFQIVDDILDFSGDEKEMGKPIGSDLMQGTLTLPSLLLMERSPKSNPIKRLFRDRRCTKHLAEAILMVQNSDILEESYAVARDFAQSARAALEPLPDTPARHALSDITEYVLERRA
ncbi:MAG: polyprenyl synthetase family protein [Candidatus Bathyarchaeota archaeon]|nr:polyprenyl synthetase family protein [Candidatus Bathyarchaeota archaeon]